MKLSRSQSCLEGSPKSLNKPGQFITHEQASLFAQEEAPVPGSLNDGKIIRGIITDCIRNSSKSRDQVAEEITRLVGEKVTVRMLNSYTSEAADQHRWPLQYTRAFCYAVQDWTLLRALVELSGLHLIGAAEMDLLELGREFLKQKRAADEIKKLEARLGGVNL